MGVLKDKSLVKKIIEIIPFISKKRIYQVILLQIFALFSSLLESFSVGAIFPFIAALNSSDVLLNNSKYKFILDYLGIEKKSNFILFFTIGFVFLVCCSAFIKWLLLYFNSSVSNKIGTQVSAELFKRSLYQPYILHTNRNSSEMLVGFARANELVSLIILPLFNLINSFFTIFFIVIVLLYVNPLYILSLLFIMVMLYLIVMFFVKKILHIESEKISLTKPSIYKVIQESLGGIRDVILDGTQIFFTEIYLRLDIQLRKSSARLAVINISPNIILQSLGIAILAAFAGAIAFKGNMGTGLELLGVLAFGYLRISPALQQIYSSWASLNSGKKSLDYILEFLKIPLPTYSNINNTSLIKFEDIFKLDNISFKYPNSENVVLNNFNITVNKGSKIGIVGKTGSGKSTLIDIMMGLITPNEGSLIVDNKIISEENIRSWQMHIAHVPQFIYLSDSTIAENIAFGIEKNLIDFDAVKLAAKQAQISDTIEQLDNKYNTSIGERGVRLSGGQRQRIGIARALYKKADVIIFDEATSSLDSVTEAEVMKSINDLSKELTIIIIAHRFSTLKNCDCIYEINDRELIFYENYNEFIVRMENNSN
jgi:ABC-type multidrug transport system fused ATPase/permease subunit